MKTYIYLKKKNKINNIVDISNYSILEDEDILNEKILYKAEVFEDFLDKIAFINLKFFKKLYVDFLLSEFIIIFDLFWEFEFRSSNFGAKTFYFFSVWHTSATRISFFDFLLKTKLLQDEKQFRIFYDTELRKRNRRQMNRDKRRLAKFWKVVDGYKKPKNLVAELKEDVV